MKDGLLVKNATAPVDFKVYTAALESDPDAPIMRGTGSSTIIDLQNDVMEVTALADMEKAPRNLTIFLNHSYSVPEDVQGGLTKTKMAIEAGIADMLIEWEVEEENPRAMTTYRMGKKRRLGISGGFSVDEYRIDDDGPNGETILHIVHTTAFEWSVVGIPANQRSWVEHAAAGIFARNYDPKLASIVKSLWPLEYSRIVARLEDDDAREFFTKGVEPRKIGDHRLVWHPAQKSFAIETPASTSPRFLSRTQTEQFLANTVAPQYLTYKHVSHADDDAIVPTVATPDLTKTVTGKTSWPLADRDRAWDNGAAHKRLVAWAGGDDLSVAKFKSVHFYAPDDADDATNVSKYKLAFCDVIDGEIKAIPAAIFACAGGHGVNAASIPDGDKDAIKKKISTYYAHMRKEFDDDTLVAPWDKDEAKSLAEGDTIVKKDAQAASDAQKDVLADTQAVTHDDEPHADTTPAVDDTVTPPATDDAPVAPAANDDDEAAQKALREAAAQVAADTTVTQIGIVDDASAKTASAPAIDDATKAKIDLYTKMCAGIAAQLEIPQELLRAKSLDMQQAITLASSIDSLTDGLYQKVSLLNINADALLTALGVPDYDDESVATGGGSYYYSGDDAVTHKKAASGKQKKLAAMAHHALCMAFGGGHDMCKEYAAMVAETNDTADTGDDAATGNDGGDDGKTKSFDLFAAPAPVDMTPVTKSLEALTETFAALDVTAIAADVKKSVEGQITMTKAALTGLTTDMLRVKKDLADATAALEKLTGTNLGNPTKLNRNAGGTPAVKLSLEEAFANTHIVSKDGVSFRHWPDGVEPRPALTALQDENMTEQAVAAYKAGAEIDVPDFA